MPAVITTNVIPKARIKTTEFERKMFCQFSTLRNTS